MNFIVSRIAESLASYLNPFFPEVTFYEDPRQQGTALPCMFIQLMSSEVSNHLAGRTQRLFRFDLTYLDDYNLPDLQRRYQEVQEKLDGELKTFPYNNRSETQILHLYDRQSNIDMDGLHYKFTMKVWLDPTEEVIVMNSTTINLEVEYGEEKRAQVR